MKNYGIPYMGSKQNICDQIIGLFPKAENFYDLFGGGFSVTHAMLLRRKKDYKHFHFNEKKSDIVSLIQKSIAGDFNYDKFKPKFIGRDEFLKNLDDPYIRVCWSFGNNQKDYIFSKEIEPYKRSMHNAIVFNEFDELSTKVFGHSWFAPGSTITAKRLLLRNRIEYFRKTNIPEFLIKFLNEKQLEQLEELERLQQLEQLQQLERLQKLEQLEQLERLQQLEQLERLERLNFYSKSYDEIEIKENSVIYCDPPYKGTVDYGNHFDTEKFLDWAANLKFPVFISEYNISDKRFKLVKKIKKRSLMDSSDNSKKYATEKVYVNQAYFEHDIIK